MTVAQLCPTLCDSMDYTVHGILQAGILEWVTIPFSRGSFQPRDRTQVSCIAGGFFTSQSLGKPKRTWSLCFFSLETLTFGSHSPSCKKPDFSAAEPMWRARVERPRGEKTWDWGEVREREIGRATQLPQQSQGHLQMILDRALGPEVWQYVWQIDRMTRKREIFKNWPQNSQILS